MTRVRVPGGSFTRGLVFAFGLLARPAVARAQDEADPSAIAVHGFVSQGFLMTTENEYLADRSDRGSFEFTEVGINFTKELGPRLRVGLQIFAHDLGPLGNYAPQFDWYYLDYRFEDWLGLRAGRTKLPFGLYNETSDIDVARVPVLLPQSVYPVQNREVLLAQTGAELYGSVPLGDGGGRLEYRLYGGTIFLNDTNSTSALANYSVPYMVGSRLMWQTPLEGLQLGGSAQALRLDFDFTPTPEMVAAYEMQGILPPDFDGVISARIPVQIWLASIEYQAQDLLLAAEYGRTYLDIQSSLLLPDTSSVTEAYYLMGSYRVTPWFTPGLTYSVRRPSLGENEGRDAYQHDLALTTRYDLNPYWLVKLEGHVMHGTAALDSDLNGGTPIADLTTDWGLFLVKTTAYF